jgi:GST-like protein
MITLHTWTTPNGRKISIMLEELGIPYQVRAVNIGKNEQFTPEFLAISPNNKIPAIVDDETDDGPQSVFESGAILVYLAEKYGRFLAGSGPARYSALEWLNWQMSGLGPMVGQYYFFENLSAEKSPPAIQRFTAEADRLLCVMEKRLAAVPYLAGQEYTIADMAAYPWALGASMLFKDVLADSLAAKPALARWLKTIGERPAVQRGMEVPKV